MVINMSVGEKRVGVGIGSWRLSRSLSSRMGTDHQPTWSILIIIITDIVTGGGGVAGREYFHSLFLWSV